MLIQKLIQRHFGKPLVLSMIYVLLMSIVALFFADRTVGRVKFCSQFGGHRSSLQLAA